VFGLNNPTDASTGDPGHSSRLVNDGDPTTCWAPVADDNAMSVTIDTERLLEIHSLKLRFPQGAPYGFQAEIKDREGRWRVVAEQAQGQDFRQDRIVETSPIEGRQVRIKPLVPAGAIAGLCELSVAGKLRDN